MRSPPAAAAPDAEAGEWAAVARSVRLCAARLPRRPRRGAGTAAQPVRLAPGEAIYLGAGNVHAYLRGTAVEVMANSDNVLRCGLTAKHVDVAELLRVTDFSELDAAPLAGREPGRSAPTSRSRSRTSGCC